MKDPSGVCELSSTVNENGLLIQKFVFLLTQSYVNIFFDRMQCDRHFSDNWLAAGRSLITAYCREG